MSEKFWYLKRCNLFEQLTPEQLRHVESRCRFRKIPRNTPIYLPADEADGVLLLATGRVKICSFTPDGKQSILTFIEPGEIFGELAIFEQGEREEYAEAAETSNVLLIPNTEMQRLIEEHPTVSVGITKLFGLRRKRIERRLKYLLFHSNRDRLIHLLLELVETYGQKADIGIELGIKLSHQDLANIIGSTRETVTVTLGELQAAGLLRIARRRITLVDLEGLASSIQVAPPKIDREESPNTPQPGSTRDRTARTFP